MTGQRATMRDEAAAIHSQIMSFTLKATLARYTPLFYCERTMVIESVHVRTEALDTNTAALTGNLAYAADAVALSTNTDITGTVPLGSGNGAAATVQTATLLPSTSGVVPTENVVAGEKNASGSTAATKGRMVLFETSAAPDASLGPVTITLRVTTIQH